jgi:methionyl-tRNA formyltransferase
MTSDIKFVFFGTPEIAVTILDELALAGFVPELVVTREDKPQGRRMEISSPPVKIWAEERGIRVFQPTTLRNGGAFDALKILAPERGWDVFIVAAYGNIIPPDILSLPKHGCLNVHPSLLPRLRGASPIQSAILDEDKTGVTIMRLDEEMDHGPIVAQKEIISWDGLGSPEHGEGGPPYEPELEKILANEGGRLLAETLPKWINGDIKEIPQDHHLATFTKKIEKDDAEINLSDSPELNLRKIRAFVRWPKAFVYADTKRGHMRVIITRASIKKGALVIESVIPEGKKEMSFEDFQRGFF